MIKLKRDLVKYIRDRAKSGYKKGIECYICGETSNLDFHHFYSLSPLLYGWVKKHKKVPEEVLEFRDEFIQEHTAELCRAEQDIPGTVLYTRLTRYTFYMVQYLVHGAVRRGTWYSTWYMVQYVAQYRTWYRSQDSAW